MKKILMILILTSLAFATQKHVCDTCAYTSDATIYSGTGHAESGDTVLYRHNSNGKGGNYDLNTLRSPQHSNIYFSSEFSDDTLSGGGGLYDCTIYFGQDSLTYNGFTVMWSATNQPNYLVRQNYEISRIRMLNCTFIGNGIGSWPRGVYLKRNDHSTPSFANTRSLFKKCVFKNLNFALDVQEYDHCDIDSNIFDGTTMRVGDSMNVRWNILRVSGGETIDMSYTGDTVEYNFFNSQGGAGEFCEWCYSANNPANISFKWNQIDSTNHNAWCIDGINNSVFSYNRITNNLDAGGYDGYNHGSVTADSSWLFRFVNNSHLCHAGSTPFNFNSATKPSDGLIWDRCLFFNLGGTWGVANVSNDTLSNCAFKLATESVPTTDFSVVTNNAYSKTASNFVDTAFYGFWKANNTTYTSSNYPGALYRLLNRKQADSTTSSGFRVQDSISWGFRHGNGNFTWSNTWYTGDSGKVYLIDSSSAASWTIRDSSSLSPAGSVVTLHKTGGAEETKYYFKTYIVGTVQSGSVRDTSVIDSVTTSGASCSAPTITYKAILDTIGKAGRYGHVTGGGTADSTVLIGSWPDSSAMVAVATKDTVAYRWKAKQSKAGYAIRRYGVAKCDSATAYDSITVVGPAITYSAKAWIVSVLDSQAVTSSAGAFDSIICKTTLPTGLTLTKASGQVKGTTTDSLAQTGYVMVAYKYGIRADSTTFNITSSWGNVVIDSVGSPDSGYVGDTVKVYGRGFGSSQGSSTISFGDSTPTVTSWSNTLIKFLCPDIDTGTYDFIAGVAGAPDTLEDAYKVLEEAAPPPTITAQPANDTVCADSLAYFSLTATGTGTLSYQWYRNSATVGSDNNYYGTYTGSDGDSVWCVVTDDNGSTTSDTVFLTEYDATNTRMLWIASTGQTDMNDTLNYWPHRAISTACTLTFKATSVVNASASANLSVAHVLIGSQYSGQWSISGRTLTCAGGFVDSAASATRNYGNGISLGGSMYVGPSPTATSCVLTFTGSGVTLNNANAAALTIARLIIGPSASLTISGTQVAPTAGTTNALTMRTGSTLTYTAPMSFGVTQDGASICSLATDYSIVNNNSTYIRPSANDITVNLPAFTGSGTPTRSFFLVDGGYSGSTLQLSGALNVGNSHLKIKNFSSSSGLFTFRSGNQAITCRDLSYGCVAAGTESLQVYMGQSAISATTTGYDASRNGTTAVDLDTCTETHSSAAYWWPEHTIDFGRSNIVMTTAASVTSSGKKLHRATLNAPGLTVTAADTVRSVYLDKRALTTKAGVWIPDSIVPHIYTPTSGRVNQTISTTGYWDTTGLAFYFGDTALTVTAKTDTTASVTVKRGNRNFLVVEASGMRDSVGFVIDSGERSKSAYRLPSYKLAAYRSIAFRNGTYR